MSLSLRDQLLQAGLLSEKQAKQAGRQQSQQRREQARKPTAAVDEQQLAAQRAAQAKLERDRQLDRQRQEQAERKARKAQVRQLVEQNRLPKPDADTWYNFADGKKIRRLPADAALRARLCAGEIVIVRCDGRYELVPAAVGERIRERDPPSLVHQAAAAAGAATVDDNDPYKDYVVPDDLMW